MKMAKIKVYPLAKAIESVVLFVNDSYGVNNIKWHQIVKQITVPECIVTEVIEQFKEFITLTFFNLFGLIFCSCTGFFVSCHMIVPDKTCTAGRTSERLFHSMWCSHMATQVAFPWWAMVRFEAQRARKTLLVRPWWNCFKGWNLKVKVKKILKVYSQN